MKVGVYLEVEESAHQREKHRAKDQLPTLVQISDGQTGRGGSRGRTRGRTVALGGSDVTAARDLRNAHAVH